MSNSLIKMQSKYYVQLEFKLSTKSKYLVTRPLLFCKRAFSIISHKKLLLFYSNRSVHLNLALLNSFEQ